MAPAASASWRTIAPGVLPPLSAMVALPRAATASTQQLGDLGGRRMCGGRRGGVDIDDPRRLPRSRLVPAADVGGQRVSG